MASRNYTGCAPCGYIGQRGKQNINSTPITVLTFFKGGKGGEEGGGGLPGNLTHGSMPAKTSLPGSEGALSDVAVNEMLQDGTFHRDSDTDKWQTLSVGSGFSFANTR